MSLFFNKTVTKVSHQARVIFAVVDALINQRHFKQALTEISTILNEPGFATAEKELASIKAITITQELKTTEPDYRPTRGHQ